MEDLLLFFMFWLVRKTVTCWTLSEMSSATALAIFLSCRVSSTGICCGVCCRWQLTCLTRRHCSMLFFISSFPRLLQLQSCVPAHVYNLLNRNSCEYKNFRVLKNLRKATSVAITSFIWYISYFINETNQALGTVRSQVTFPVIQTH